jgi:DNA-binding response OmpR family regulator
MLRRARGFDPERRVIRLGDRLEIRPAEGLVHLEGREVHLTLTEFRLLSEMASSPGRVFSKEMLLDLVWDYPPYGDTKLVSVHIHRLRAKIEAEPSDPQHVVTVRGLGYKVVP